MFSHYFTSFCFQTTFFLSMGYVYICIDVYIYCIPKTDTEWRTYFSRSVDYNDELAWAGAWLYKATNETKYLTQAETYYVTGASWGQSWDDKTAGCQVHQPQWLVFCALENWSKYILIMIFSRALLKAESCL